MSTFQALRHPPIAILWSGLVLSAIGDEFFRIALVWFSVSLLGTAAGIVAAIQAAASVGAGMFGGAFVDRFRHRDTLLAVDALRALAVLALPVLDWFGRLHLPALIGVTVCVAGLGAFFDPALQASLPRLTADKRVLQATNGLFDATRRLARIVGPGLVAVMQGIVPAIHLFTLDAISFIFSLGAVIGVSDRLRQDHQGASQSGSEKQLSFRQQFAQGFTCVRNDLVMQYMLIGHGVVNGAWYLGLVLSTALRLKVDMPDAIGAYGLLISAYGVGNVLSNLVVGGIDVRRPMLLLIAGRFVAAAGFVELGLSSTFPGMLAGSFLAAVGAPMSNMPFLIRLQSNFQGANVARIYRLRLVAESVFILVSLSVSPIAYRLMNPSQLIIGCGIVIALIGGAGIFLSRTLFVNR